LLARDISTFMQTKKTPILNFPLLPSMIHLLFRKTFPHLHFSQKVILTAGGNMTLAAPLSRIGTRAPGILACRKSQAVNEHAHPHPHPRAPHPRPRSPTEETRENPDLYLRLRVCGSLGRGARGWIVKPDYQNRTLDVVGDESCTHACVLALFIAKV
jgi:hypothetical protein